MQTRTAMETGPQQTDRLGGLTWTFALATVRLTEQLPRTRTADVMGRQLLRSGTSAGANYRAARRARSAADFVAKLGIVEEEADESLYWLELLVACGAVPDEQVHPLRQTASEILALTVASIRTTRARHGLVRR